MKENQVLFFVKTFIHSITKTTAHKDISYISPDSPEYNKRRHLLDVYIPKNLNKKKEVVVFIHGGKWKVGNKGIFGFIGKKFALHGIIGVVINYRLYPQSPTYEGMTMDCAHAVKWVYENIEKYGGDKNRIYLAGHSSGGHLSALIVTNNRFFDSVGIINPVKGCVLLDAFGLNIETYLQAPLKEDEWIYDIFTRNPSAWYDAAPVNFVHENSPDFLMYTGGNSPAKIQNDSRLFCDIISNKKKKTKLTTLKGVGHLSIIFQLKYTKHPLFNEFIRFMNS
jgi:acetyl esterase/lipase